MKKIVPPIIVFLMGLSSPISFPIIFMIGAVIYYKLIEKVAGPIDQEGQTAAVLGIVTGIIVGLLLVFTSIFWWVRICTGNKKGNSRDFLCSKEKANVLPQSSQQKNGNHSEK